MTSSEPKMSSRDPNTLKAQYLENNWRCYLATIADYKIVCCETVQSAILATAWLLVPLATWDRRISKPQYLGHCRWYRRCWNDARLIDRRWFSRHKVSAHISCRSRRRAIISRCQSHHMAWQTSAWYKRTILTQWRDHKSEHRSVTKF